MINLRVATNDFLARTRSLLHRAGMEPFI